AHADRALVIVILQWMSPIGLVRRHNVSKLGFGHGIHLELRDGPTLPIGKAYRPALVLLHWDAISRRVPTVRRKPGRSEKVAGTVVRPNNQGQVVTMVFANVP